MANKYLSGAAHHALVNRRQADDRRRQSNWLHSIIAGLAMLVVSSLGVVLIFDWYFFSVIDGLSTSLRPIAGAFHHASGVAKSITDKPDQQRAGDQAGSPLVVPVDSSANSKTPAK